MLTQGHFGVLTQSVQGARGMVGISRTQDPRADFQMSNSPLAQQDPPAHRLQGRG